MFNRGLIREQQGMNVVDDVEVKEIEGGKIQGIVNNIRKRGRDVSSCWSLFTNERNPHKLLSAVCKHCSLRVKYHKKSEQAKTHLMRCKPFIKYMNRIELKPVWYLETSIKKKYNKKSEESASLFSNFSTSNGGGSSMKQPSISNSDVPKLTKKELKSIEECMAMHYYITGSSFQRIEEENLIKAFKICRPDVVLPSRKKLAGALLDQCYDVVKKQVTTYLQSAHAPTACLTIDAWSNINSESVVNYMAISVDKSFFIESRNTGEQSHTSAWLAEDISRIIDKVPCKIAGAVTDNTSDNKAAWELLQAKYPTMFFQGCTSHGLHLLVKDIFSATKTKKCDGIQGTYPCGYPFEELLNFAIDCKDIVSYFHNHHSIKEKLKEELDRNYMTALVKPAPTRWGTLQGCFLSLLNAEGILYAIVNHRDFIQGTSKNKEQQNKIKDMITAASFVELLQKSLAILKPIDKLITMFQSDSIPISEVFPSFKNLVAEFQEVQEMTQGEKDYAVQLAVKRYQFLSSKGHAFAYLLDPVYIGEKFTSTEKLATEEELFNFPLDDVSLSREAMKEALFLDYTQFEIEALHQRKNTNNFIFKMLKDRKKTPLQYWITNGSKWPNLQSVALKLFTIVSTSAASEKMFSTFGFFHTKLRNRLTTERIAKLVFIKTNAIHFCSNALNFNSDEDIDAMDDQIEDISSRKSDN